MSVRLFIVLVLTLVAMLALFLVLLATDTALSVWQRLGQSPLWMQFAYGIVLALASTAAVALAWRWLSPRKKPGTRQRKSRRVSSTTLQEELLASAAAGVDVESAVAELREQRRRRSSGEVHIALFGEVSTGKSSLVRALLPDAEAESDPRAGTTTEVRRYAWTSEGGDTVVISDLPGFNLDDDTAIVEEARRAHLVVFLCDGDLTDSQARQLGRLQRLEKPMIIALNKMDRYGVAEAAAIIENISKHTGVAKKDIVRISTGGKEDVVRMLVDGSKTTVTLERDADIGSLRLAIQRNLDENRGLMEELHDTAVLLLAAEKLEAARNAHREEEAAELVTVYSRRAVVGAMAAVAPGSDLVIQGVLATRLVQELCALYGVSVKEVQIESFLKLAGSKVRNMSAITLAIAGNALKAFPGVGTLSGGLLHAVAYGLIFDSLGRAAAQTLASRGDLRPYPAAEAFEDLMRENLVSGAGRFAKLAVSQKTRDHTS
ncbi:MAG: GTP-binding protein HSR1 [Xanthomonadales bacterium]|nr:GTP-binding protein HSR1 [Xanthomonadales bacterium]